MKRCRECNAVYEDQYDRCPTCGMKLEPLNSDENFSSENGSYYQDEPRQTGDRHRPDPTRNTYIFERQEGGRVIINGAVAEANTQQYYPTKFAKFFQAVFYGEPYQFSHTTFVTIFRVEEHTTRGYPEHARDITVYGNMENLFAVGDDLTVEAKRKGNKYVAKRIHNHSINSDVHIQPYIPAGIIRLGAVALIALIIMFICSLPAIGRSIVNLFSMFIPLIVVIAVFWYIIKSFFKRK